MRWTHLTLWIWNLFEVFIWRYDYSIRVLLVWWLFFRRCVVLYGSLHLGSIFWLFGERKKGTRISLVAMPGWFGCLVWMLLYQPKKKVCWLHCVVTGRLIWPLIILLLNEIRYLMRFHAVQQEGCHVWCCPTWLLQDLQLYLASRSSSTTMSTIIF